MKDLLILSDLWGLPSADWIQDYLDFLSPTYHIRCYDVQELAGISKTLKSQDEIHQAFVSGGIQKAVQQLLSNETEPVSVLAFSIGGTIAWKATLEGLKADELFLLSATRLRYEEAKPTGKIHLIFGEEDLYKPHKEWIQKMKVDSYRLIKGEGHEFYRNAKFFQEGSYN